MYDLRGQAHSTWQTNVLKKIPTGNKNFCDNPGCDHPVCSAHCLAVWVSCNTCKILHEYHGVRGCGVVSTCPICNSKEFLCC